MSKAKQMTIYLSSFLQLGRGVNWVHVVRDGPGEREPIMRYDVRLASTMKAKRVEPEGPLAESASSRALSRNGLENELK
jgi:hypothetical protein